MSSKTTPQTSIIILNWNNYEMTAACIGSLLKTDPADSEIVVLDNGSTDGSVEKISQEFPGITLLREKVNLGFAGGCNVAIRRALAAGSKYVLLLNNDTHVATDFLKQMVHLMETDPRIGAVCPKLYFATKPEAIWYAGGNFNPWTGIVTMPGLKQTDRGQFESVRDITAATGCAMLIRSEALSAVGLLDESYWAYVEDLDLSLRLADKGYRLLYAPKAHVWHWDGATAVKSQGSGSKAVRQYLSTRNMLFLARRHLHWWHVPTFTVGFLIGHVAFYSAIRIWHRDFRALAAVYKGVAHGLSRPLQGPELPKESLQS